MMMNRASADETASAFACRIYQDYNLLELYSFDVETIAKHVTSFYALDEKTIFPNNEKPRLLKYSPLLHLI